MMQIELVQLDQYKMETGIGRYVHQLHKHLQPLVDVTFRQPRLLPFANRFSFLKHLPIGIQGHKAGSIVHFPQIMGCAMMLWNPIRPAIATVHDLGVLELPEEWAMLDPIARQILKLSLAGLQRMDLIITDSEFTRQGVLRHLNVSPDKVVTIHLGIDHQIFRPIPDAAEQLTAKYPELANCSRPWLLYVGSELPRKNIPTLLEAAAILRQEFPGLHLLKVGSVGGQQFRQRTLQLTTELKLQGTVRFFENVPDDDLALFYNAADLLVQPSYLEGFGFPVLEAMACGTATICSNTTSLPEVVGDAALLINPNDDNAMYKAMWRLLNDTETRDKLRAKGLARAEKFSWGTVAAQTLELYKLFD